MTTGRPLTLAGLIRCARRNASLSLSRTAYACLAFGHVLALLGVRLALSAMMLFLFLLIPSFVILEMQFVHNFQLLHLLYAIPG
jgi:hypothetical protein